MEPRPFNFQMQLYMAKFIGQRTANEMIAKAWSRLDSAFWEQKLMFTDKPGYEQLEDDLVMLAKLIYGPEIRKVCDAHEESGRFHKARSELDAAYKAEKITINEFWDRQNALIQEFPMQGKEYSYAFKELEEKVFQDNDTIYSGNVK